jgi:hypothetical protein
MIGHPQSDTPTISLVMSVGLKHCQFANGHPAELGQFLEAPGAFGEN